MVKCEQHLSKLLMIMIKMAPASLEISCKDTLTKTAVKPLVSARGYKSVPWDTREFTLGETM